ncbi:MAG: PAS domain-containing protein [Hyphomonadaceae bacterium]
MASCALDTTDPTLTAMMGEETFHPDTRALLAYGRALAGANQTPPKKGGADQVLERLFVIERAKDGRLPIKTFGTELINVFGRDMREHDFARLFLPADKALMAALIDASVAAGEPAIARVRAETIDGRSLGAEILITPLKIDNTLGERLLGLFQSLGGEQFLDGRHIHRLRLGSLHPPQAKEPKGMRLVVVND